ncbi:MAG: RHS repeat-associated core domain-containing protein [Wenzhouxiangellaceae bacterium]
MIAPNNATTTFDFDQLSRQTAENSPDRGTIRQEYDLADNLTASTDARGIRREMEYDPLNRLKTVTFPEPGEDITYTYDTCLNGTGRICKIIDESGTVEYEYDGFGNITRTTRTELGIEYITDYEYDLEDRITAIVYPSDRRVEYQRDILGRVTEVRAEVAGQMQPILNSIEYRADGQITAATFGNGLIEGREYDLQGRLTHQILADGAGLIVDERNYTYDPAGNITARTGTPGDQHYNYDALDRLTGQDIQTDGKTWQYDYGPNHNRQSRKDGDLLEELYSYQPETNRLNEIDKFLGEPDQSIPRSRQFIYNQANRFAEYIEDGETMASYTYNALGQRTRKELQSGITLFHYDIRISLLTESDDAGNLTREYLWLNNRPIAQIESTGVITYLHTDHLLTPRAGTSDAQAIVWRWEGETFGDFEASEVMEVNLRFPGQYFDRETEQHYNHFRDYLPGLGRYAQSDPIGMLGGINQFNYGNVNPLRFIDPFGRTGFESLENFCFGQGCICRAVPALCPPPPPKKCLKCDDPQFSICINQAASQGGRSCTICAVFKSPVACISCSADALSIAVCINTHCSTSSQNCREDPCDGT